MGDCYACVSVICRYTKTTSATRRVAEKRVMWSGDFGRVLCGGCTFENGDLSGARSLRGAVRASVVEKACLELLHRDVENSWTVDTTLHY